MIDRFFSFPRLAPHRHAIIFDYMCPGGGYEQFAMDELEHYFEKGSGIAKVEIYAAAEELRQVRYHKGGQWLLPKPFS